MKLAIQPRLLTLLLAFTVPAAMTVSTDADAGFFKKVKKGIKKTGKEIAKDIEDSEELKDAAKAGKKSYEATAKAGESAYKKANEEVQKGINDAKKAILLSTAKAYIGKNKDFLEKFRKNIDKLAENENTLEAVERLIEAAAEKRLDDQARKDTLLVGEALGMLGWKPNSIVPGSSGGAFKSSWGLAVSGGGAYIGGVEGAFGLVANCYQEPDKTYGAGLFLEVGGVLGIAYGGSVSVTFYWQPGGVSEAAGGSVGLGVEAAYGAFGGTLGVQWSVAEGMKGASAGIPGFFLGWASGVKIKAGALQGGYSWVPVKSTK